MDRLVGCLVSWLSWLLGWLVQEVVNWYHAALYVVARLIQRDAGSPLSFTRAIQAVRVGKAKTGYPPSLAYSSGDGDLKFILC